MRRVFATFIGFAMLLNFVSMYIAFAVIQNGIKKEMAIGARSDKPANLRLFLLTQAQFRNLHWSEKDKEFSYESEMFDVVKIEPNGQQIKVYAINDTQEKDLIENFISLFHKEKKNEDATSPISSILNSLFSALVIASSHYTAHFFHYTSYTYMKVFLVYDSYISDETSPPPDFS